MAHMHSVEGSSRTSEGLRSQAMCWIQESKGSLNGTEEALARK